jgi:hypothetical protein
VLQEDNQEQGAPAIAPQPDAQRQQARTIRFPQGKRRKMVELPIADNFEKRDDGWYYKGYNGGRWDNTKIKKAEILEALNALDAAVNNAVNQIVAQGPQNLQAVVQNNNQQIKEIVVHSWLKNVRRLNKIWMILKAKLQCLSKRRLAIKTQLQNLDNRLNKGWIILQIKLQRLDKSCLTVKTNYRTYTKE